MQNTSTENLQSVENILERIKTAKGLRTYGELATFLGVKYSALMAWKGRNSSEAFQIISARCSDMDLNWVFTGIARDVDQDAARTPYAVKVVEMMQEMDEDTQKDICLSVQKEKLLRELLRQKQDAKAG